MNTAPPTASSSAHRLGGARLGRAFTLIEILVVVALMALLAALVLGGATFATNQKKISRVEAELSKWVTLVELYHDRMGFYPPCNSNNPALNPLFYELSGTVLDASANTYRTLNGLDTVDRALVGAAFNLGGFLNASTEATEVKNFGKNIQSNQVINVSLPGGGAVKVPLVPVRGPGPFGEPDTVTNTWRYNSLNPTNNPDSYDLWAEILIGNEVRVIGNWKR